MAQDIWDNYCVKGVIVEKPKIIEHFRSYANQSVDMKMGKAWKILLWGIEDECSKETTIDSTPSFKPLATTEATKPLPIIK